MQRSIATDFRRWRKHLKLSQAGAAEALGLSLSRVKDLDAGIHRGTGAPAVPDRKLRLAMAAVAAGLAPWN
jgi:predicted transcriptional regulator